MKKSIPIIREWESEAFILGNGREREFPLTPVMPETHLPKMPRIVTHETRYQARKRKLDENQLQYLRIKAGTEHIQVAHGDILEKKLFEVLKEFYKNQKVVVFWGPKLRLSGKAPGHQEFDFCGRRPELQSNHQDRVNTDSEEEDRSLL